MNQTNGNATKVASRYYLAPEAAGNSASINGVDVSTGKITYDTNDIATSQLTLSRQYSSAGVSPDAMGGWQHNYSSSLDAGGIPTTEWQGAKSTEYPDAETACESGWQQISGSAYNGQLQTADAVFNAGLCELKLNGTTVARLPVQGSDGNSSYPVHILTRADGSRITFYEQNGEWATTTREPYQLASTASGWNVTTPDGSVESYNLAGKFDSITNPQGQTTTLSYNGAGQLETVTSPFGQALTFSYTDGKLTQAKSAAGTTAYAYGADGKLSQVTLPDGGTQSYCYTADGKLDSISDATGAVVARYTYDTEGRVIHTEAAAGTQARAFAYNGAETSVTDVANATTDTYAHRIIHSLARATRSTDSAGAVETTEYDTNGYPTKTVDKNGLVTLTTWNARGLPESTTTAAGTAQARTIVTEWHPHFRKPSKQVAAGMVTLYEYDTDGKLTNTTAGSPAATASRMSARSATTQLQAMRSISSRAALKSAGYEVQESTIAYNDAGQPTETIAPNGASTHYDYDTAGNQTAVTNALNHTSKTLKYDAAGRALKTRDENGLTTTNVYDVAGRLTNSTTNGQTTTYAYDVAGRQTKTTYPDGSYSTTAYDAAGNTASTTDAQGTATTYTYDSNGNQLTESLTDASGNTRQTSRRDYNALNQLEKSTDADGNVTTYGYDKAGNQTSVTDASGRVTTHEYDPQNRLVKTTDAAGGITQYAYDADGNRTTVIAANGATTAYGLQPNSNRLTQIGSTAQTQDANGNLLNDGTHAYTYNAQNRLASVDGTTAYSYNADDQRVKKTTPAGTTLYAWDNDQIIGEYATANGTAQQTAETVYFGNTPVALIQNGNIYRIHADQIDTPRIITDASGKTVWAWESKPFGETLPDADPDKDGLALHYSQRFPGQTFDAETGLHYNFHRDYNPQTGRYVQSDPIGLDGGMNSFGYVINTPTAFYDLHGLKPGDNYSSMDSAGIQGIKDVNGASIKEYKEYGGSVCSLLVYDPKSKTKITKYTYSKPNKGAVGTVTPSACSSGSMVADYHTHGGPTNKYDVENFSDQDKEGNEENGIPGYLGTPAGNVKKYIPSGQGKKVNKGTAKKPKWVIEYYYLNGRVTTISTGVK